MIPAINADLTDRLIVFLQGKHEMKKRPFAAAGFLALVIALHKKKLPFPPRQDAADAIGCSKFGLDAAISVALARGLITPRSGTIQGNVERRESVVRVRYYDPAPELLAVAR